MSDSNPSAIEWIPAVRFSTTGDAWIARLDNLPVLQLHRNRSEGCWFLLFGGMKWRLNCENADRAKVLAVRVIRRAMEEALQRLSAPAARPPVQTDTDPKDT